MAAKAPIPSYQDMIESYQLMESDMNEQCSNETLEELAPKLTCWRLDPLHLGRATVGRIERSSDSEEQRQKNYLIRWSKQSGLDATYESLARYFLESGLTALAEDVCRGCRRAVGAEGGMSWSERDSAHMQGDCQPFTQAREASTTTEMSRPPSQLEETISLEQSKSLHQRKDTRYVRRNRTVIAQESSLGHMDSGTREKESENIMAKEAFNLANRTFDMVKEERAERRAIMEETFAMAASNKRKEEENSELERRSSEVMLTCKEEKITKLTNELCQMTERLESERQRFENELREKERKISELEQKIQQSEGKNEKDSSENVKRKIQEEKNAIKQKTKRQIEHLENDAKKANSEVERTVTECKRILQKTKQKTLDSEEDEEDDEIASLMSEIEKEVMKYKLALLVVFAILVMSHIQRQS